MIKNSKPPYHTSPCTFKESLMPSISALGGDVYRGTTPIHVFETDIDLTEAKVFVTYQQNHTTIVEKTNEDLEINQNTVISTITQRESLKFKLGPIDVQIRYITKDGFADASEILVLDAKRILKEGMISYEHPIFPSSYEKAKDLGFKGTAEEWNDIIGQSGDDPNAPSATSNYNDLKNKPSINGVTLKGNHTFESLGEETITNSEIKDIIDKYFSEVFVNG